MNCFKNNTTDYSQISKKIIKYRRDLHMIPELGYKEYETGKYILKATAEMDCQVESAAGTGFLFYFDFKKPETLAFRCDMDALPINEQTDFPFISHNPGKMHACGHDGHMAIMLGFMEIIDDIKKCGESLPHNILCIFQPAEEIILGAREICRSGILDKYNIKAIFGTHIWPAAPAGYICTMPGAMMARSTEINVVIEGLSSHAGEPEKGKDALEAAAVFISHVYAYKRANLPSNSVLKFGKMISGNVRNAISARTELFGTTRTFDDKIFDMMIAEMEAAGKMIEKNFGVSFSLDSSNSHPCVVNDPVLYKKIKPVLENLNFVEMKEPVKIAEDFSFYQEKYPGVFFHLGTDSSTPLHSADYYIDESALIEGVKLFEALAKTQILSA